MFYRLAQIGSALLLLALTARAADYYVSTTGSNSSNGSIGSPWRTVGKAAATASAGDTVFVRGGVYTESVIHTRSGTSANRITIQNFPGETPVLDGTAVGASGDRAMLRINGADYVTYQGFEIRDLNTTASGPVPTGIRIIGGAIGVSIVDCHIHNITTTQAAGNAHGILASGNSSTAISDLEIRDCLIEDLLLGNSEALVINGNVDGFVVTGNTVRNCNNIGIDFIGHEGTNPVASRDQARNGVCSNNTVYNCSSLNNPSYNEYSAGGIYVDGGRDIIIERNRVYACDIGVEIAAEAPGLATSRITVRDNVLWRNWIGGIFTGGYSEFRGSTEDCVITGNTCYQNDVAPNSFGGLGFGNGELYIRWKTYGLYVRNNIFHAHGDQNLVVSNISTDTSGLDLNYNVFYGPWVGGEWSWGNENWFAGFNTWKNTSGGDANSVFGQAGFVSTTGDISTFDLRITTSSVAYNAGDPSYTPDTDQIEAFGNPRVASGRVDCGAHEVPMLSAIEQWRLTFFGTDANAGDAADLADLDRDGQTNLEEFAFGSDPTRGSAGALAVVTPGTVDFMQAAISDDEVDLTVLASPSVVGGSWTAIASRAAGGDWSTVADVTVSKSGENVAVNDFRNSAGSAMFYRVQVGR